MTGRLNHRNMGAALSARPLLLVLAGLAAVASPVWAQAPAAHSAQQAATGAVMHVAINKSQVLKLDRAFAKAMIGNPDIADVMPVSTNSIYVLGREMGATNLAIYDRRGDLISVVDVLVGPDMLDLKRQIATTFPGERVQVTPVNDSLMLEGTVSGPLVAERIMALAESYAPDKVLNLLSVGSPQQVLLEVRVSEMSRGTVKQLGLNHVSWSSGSVQGSSDREAGPFVGALRGLFGSSLDVQFEALEREGLVRTLANPNLVALSGESANFLAGGEIPVPSGVDNNGRVSVEFKPFGVALAFTPTVLQDGLINMRVAPEVSSLDRDVVVQLDGATIPGLKVRRAVTSLELRDGQSFAMAGLIQSDYSNSMRRVPLLGRLPIIGALFRSSSFQKSETELVIVVTPRLVQPLHSDQLRLPTDRSRAPSDTDLFLMGKLQKDQPAQPSVSVQPGGIDAASGHILR